MPSSAAAARARFFGEPGGCDAGAVPKGPSATAFTSGPDAAIVKAEGRVRRFGDRGGGIAGTSVKLPSVSVCVESLSGDRGEGEATCRFEGAAVESRNFG